MAVLLVLDNPVFRNFLGYAALVLVKTVAMSSMTTVFRITRKVFATPEDAAVFGIKFSPTSSDPMVDRVKKAHLNDLENVVPFALLGLLYVTTGPSLDTANLYFRIFTASRFIHTFAYLFAIPQPTRALAFYAGFGVNIAFAFNILRQASF
ncbi:unnamed protein product [Candidula unifasciata]|uniref:Microsomal glutathione S-transferase 1 n=1 Tax=Candidula unifasciata TaxID=100452 RepID=A0A8S3YWI7_9EUPU|nr:unnamed protein product [Candidula unifasciata]